MRHLTSSLRDTVLIVSGAVALGCFHMDGAGRHRCDASFSASFGWDGGKFDLDHYEPRYCPVSISDGYTDLIQSSGWVTQRDDRIFETSSFAMLRPGGTPITENQLASFLYYPGEVGFSRASHGVEYEPGGDALSRCYDTANYLVQDHVTGGPSEWANLAITYRYEQTTPYGCDGGGAAELRSPG